MDERTINPCPFCGSVHVKTYSHGGTEEPESYVQCIGCTTTGPFGWTEDEAIAAWNKRDPARLNNLVILVSRLAVALRKVAPDNGLAQKASDYLQRNDLIGSPLRAAASTGAKEE